MIKKDYDEQKSPWDNMIWYEMMICEWFVNDDLWMSEIFLFGQKKRLK